MCIAQLILERHVIDEVVQVDELPRRLVVRQASGVPTRRTSARTTRTRSTSSPPPGSAPAMLVLTPRCLPTRGLLGQSARLALPDQVVPPGSWSMEKAQLKHYKITGTPATVSPTSKRRRCTSPQHWPTPTMTCSGSPWTTRSASTQPFSTPWPAGCPTLRRRARKLSSTE